MKYRECRTLPICYRLRGAKAIHGLKCTKPLYLAGLLRSRLGDTNGFASGQDYPMDRRGIMLKGQGGILG
ncbi:uncharacterized protein PHALS_02814 [Plasmopara halstedii]|uniref:Uncharacterized protein n=1 Tax=Plasmopara halstedii TaxID=4781 RepID=A0A0N7L790_PLAHL|nr:uncharacterized protein PHALS_02814 [Plasmopara halstedii]CEG46411.1 hypothetical protein PHALS_02814 [Plasmopara halstedii]|eukprot:XP_024582780.1 hypothetical protein PHALS_02814 [Plasmopara halstedii]